MAAEIIYLGRKNNRSNVTLVKEAIENIRTTKKQHNVSQLKSLLGLINYYHRYCKNFSDTLESLHQLLVKDVKRKWRKKQRTAFEKARALIYETNILVHYDPNKLLQLACDASPYGLGAFDGTEKLVSYASRTLLKAERN